MNFVDTHCHPQFDDLVSDEPGVLSRAEQAGVKRLIAVGVSLEDSKRAIEYAAKHDNVWAAAGVHPHEATGFDKNGQKELAKLLNMLRVVAVGEIGLDYYRL